MGEEPYKDTPSRTAKASDIGLGSRGHKPMFAHMPHGLARVRLMGFREQDSVVVLARAGQPAFGLWPPHCEVGVVKV